MDHTFFIFVLILTVWECWRGILKKSAYPDSVPTRIKVLHAVVLSYVMMNVWSAVWSLLLVIFRPSILSEMGLPSDRLLVDFAYVSMGVAGTIVLFVCSRMVRRERQALKWYLILWPLSFISSMYLLRPLNVKHYQGDVLWVTGIFLSLIFAMTVTFYFLPSTRVIWLDRKR
jgi:hypothetical protein